MLERAGSAPATSGKCFNVVLGEFTTLFMLLGIIQLRLSSENEHFWSKIDEYPLNLPSKCYDLLLRNHLNLEDFHRFSSIFDQKCSFSELRRSWMMSRSINSVVNSPRTTLKHFPEVVGIDPAHSNICFFFFHYCNKILRSQR